MRALVLAVALAGCYSPSYQDCAISCAQSGVCPSGLDCVQGVCRSMTGTCGGSVDAPAGAWRFRKKLTMGRVEASTPEFAMLVRVGADADLANFAQDDGDDIQFRLIDGTTTLPHEIERFDGETGELLAWVKITLSGGTPNEMYMYYGNAETGSLQNAAQVWDSDYVGVWHLGDAPGATVADSTANDRDGAKASAGMPASLAPGQIGNGLLYKSSPQEFFSITGDAAGLDLEKMTFEAWIQPSPESGTSATPQRLLEFPATFAHRPTIDYMPIVDQRYLVVTLGNPGGVRNEAARIEPTKWNHIVVTVDTTMPNFAQIFVNGVMSAVMPTQIGQSQSNALVTIGGNQNATALSFNGNLDEVRISRSIRTVDYVRNAYSSQFGPYVSVGPAETN